MAAATTQPGELLSRPPADIGREAGLGDPLAVARAVRALAARRRLETEDGRYRLLDGRPLDPGEPESVPRTPRRRAQRAARPSVGRTEASDRRPTYADLGRAVVERLIELGRERGEAVAQNEHLRRESKDNKAARIEADQRSSRLFERVKELEAKLDMAEVNLRTVLAAARGRSATATPTDNEMEALLRILRTPGTDDGTEGEGATDPGDRPDPAEEPQPAAAE